MSHFSNENFVWEVSDWEASEVGQATIRQHQRIPAVSAVFSRRKSRGCKV